MSNIPVLKDATGAPYTPSVGSTPPPTNAPVTVYTPTGPVPGRMVGGIAVPNS